MNLASIRAAESGDIIESAVRISRRSYGGSARHFFIVDHRYGDHRQRIWGRTLCGITGNAVTTEDTAPPCARCVSAATNIANRTQENA